jgi:hypothetical protein
LYGATSSKLNSFYPGASLAVKVPARCRLLLARRHGGTGRSLLTQRLSEGGRPMLKKIALASVFALVSVVSISASSTQANTPPSSVIRPASPVPQGLCGIARC